MGVSRDVEPSHGFLQQSGLLPVQHHQGCDQGKGKRQRRIDQIDETCQRRKSEVEPEVEPRKSEVDEDAADR